MTRPRRYELPNQARYFTCSCYQRLPLFEGNHAKHEFVSALSRARERHGFLLLAWVLMPEHFHVIVVPDLPDSTVTHILTSLKASVARRVLKQLRRANDPILGQLTSSRGTTHFWQRGGGYDRNVRSTSDLEEKVRYIHENPVRRGLVTRPEDWEWSSARWFDTSEGLIDIDRPR